MARRTGILVVFAALLALVLAVGAPAALAHHSDDHTQGGGNEQSSESRPESTGGGSSGGDRDQESDHDGDADSDENTAYTEDNDNDGKRNAEDTTPSSHPSGKDRYEESGGSGNQGKAESDPDDDGRGPERCEPVSARNTGDGTCGADKPNGTGGTDIYDQDGNNGCGNDQDFDDDNEGWCGKPAEVGGRQLKPCDLDAQMPGIQPCEKVKGEIIVGNPSKPCDADATMPGIQPCDTPPVVGPDLEENPAAPEEGVLGIRLDAAQPAALAPAAQAAAPAVGAAAAAQGGVLPFTGASDLIPVVAVGLLLITAGALSLKVRFGN